MNFGFSYVGLIFLIMLMIPNIIWGKNQPKDYEKYVKNENKILLLLERIGEVGNTCLALIFSDFNINTISSWSIILLTAFLAMVLYEIYWIRYFRSEKTLVAYFKKHLMWYVKSTNCATATKLKILEFTTLKQVEELIKTL